MKIVRLASSTIVFREGILIIELTGETIINSTEANRQIKAAQKITEGKIVPLIYIDHSKEGGVSPEAGIIFMDEVKKGAIISQAAVITSLPKRMRTSFFSRTNSGIKSKVFASFNQAWKWSVENKK